MTALLAPIIAAQTAVSNKFPYLPKQVWINIAIVVIAVVIVVRLWRALRALNDYAPWFVAVLAGSMIFFYWVYERTEPRFLTPVVDQLVNFLPTKSKHERDLDRLRRSRE